MAAEEKIKCSYDSLVKLSGNKTAEKAQLEDYS